jgi:hypothetical protein
MGLLFTGTDLIGPLILGRPKLRGLAFLDHSMFASRCKYVIRLRSLRKPAKRFFGCLGLVKTVGGRDRASVSYLRGSASKDPRGFLEGNGQDVAQERIAQERIAQEGISREGQNPRKK